ncbi:MAG: N-formylglutamate amidohydrolase [Gammaproteobacteria bacterium]|nr:MAG: N-formylglutamate amidohydrolase [Gammaproteobacteria bacterium]
MNYPLSLGGAGVIFYVQPNHFLYQTMNNPTQPTTLENAKLPAAAYSIVNPNGSSDWLFVCEHASNGIPPQLHRLGLPVEVLQTHIAYDIGAAEMTCYLAEQLDATAVLCNYSRLVIDCNRALGDAACMPAVSDTVNIPANHNLSAEQRRARIEQIYRPFHTAVFNVLTDKMAGNPNMKIANIHSFTPMLAQTGEPRPWHIGFVYRDHPQGRQLTQAIMNDFCTHTNYCIGDNEPYNGFLYKGYTVPAHAEAQDIASVLVEFRQDLINTPAGVRHWGDLLLSAMHRQSTSHPTGHHEQH